MSRLVPVVALVVLACAGCASQLSMVKSDNTRLRAQVGELRADKRRADRKVRDLENELALAHDRADTTTIDHGRTGTPVLPVEVMAPDPAAAATSDLEPGARVVGVSEDGTEIIYAGDAASGKQATYDGYDDDSGAGDPPAPRPRARPHHDGADRIPSQDRVPVHATHAPASERDGAVAAEQYRAAVELLRSGHHDDAIAQLHDFLKRYPDHDYADNAQYWLGEAYYDRKDYVRALAEFRTAVDKYPHGNKVPDALLKVGYCYLALGQTEKGQFALEQVVAIYPKTDPALLAGKRLETIAP